MSKTMRRAVGMFAVSLALVGAASCSSDRGAPVVESASVSVTQESAAIVALPESAEARARLDALRARFVTTSAFRLHDVHRSGHEAPTSRAVIGSAVATSFELRDGYARAVIAPDAKRGVAKTASVALPMRARDTVRLEDDTSRVAVSFALRGANDAPIATAGGIAMYARALGGADVVHRVHAEGTEDFVVFETKPEHEEIAYDVDVSRVAGLRFVSNMLEFLDEGGTPRLRVAPPYIVDARGERSEARLAVDGCAYDTSGVGPWGRAVTRPGAASCAVRVVWGGTDVAYPAMVDPNWSATGSMAAGRESHTATQLASGRVLVAGGSDYRGEPLSSAELFDATGAGSFAATGAMATARKYHTATLLASGKVLIAAGLSTGGAAPPTAELFDPTGAGGFAATGAMANAREGHTATLLASGKVLVAGNFGIGSSTAELFDPSGAGSFTATGSMATGRHGHTATLLASGKVLIAGGDNISGSSAELFDPIGAGSFSPTGSMATPRQSHTATMLASGKVLVAGGLGVLSAELFDPTGAGNFAATGSMATARSGHTATLLASGKVLVAGGYGNGALSSAELFDPTGAGSFSPTGSMATPRQSHTATMLATGKVLVAGGYGPLSSAELYDVNCTPDTTCPAGDNCGTVPDGCGGAVSCGSCVSPQTCVQNKCASQTVDAGSDASSVDASTDAASGDASADASSANVAGNSGCGCRSARSRSNSSIPVLAMAFALVALRTRGRRRKRTGECARYDAVDSLTLIAVAVASRTHAGSTKQEDEIGGGSR